MSLHLKPPRRILHLDAAHLTAWLWQQDRPVREAQFNADEAGHADFRHYLGNVRGSLFYLLADVVEEDFRQEELPFVRGADREALLTRKLNQYFFGTPFSYAHSLGRNQQGRGDEKFVLVALTRPQGFESWLQVLEECACALVGIYASSQLMAALAAQTIKTEPRLILLTFGQSGLRQSYFEAGELRFSRLSPMHAHNLADIGAAVATEAGKIHQYLVGQRLISRGQQIAVRCLTHADDFAALRELIEDTSELAFELLPLPTQGGKDCAAATDARLIHQLGAHPPRQQFLPNKLRQHYRLWQTRLGLNLAALGSIAAAILFLLWVGLQLSINYNTIEQAELLRQSEEQRYQTLLASLPTVQTSPEHLRSLAEAGRALRAQAPALDPALVHVSQALESLPQITLNRLVWHLAAGPEELPGGSATLSAGGHFRWIVLELEAQLPASLIHDKRAQSELIERFAGHLKAGEAGGVRILSRPFDTDSSKTLKANPDQQATADALRFNIRCWLPLSP